MTRRAVVKGDGSGRCPGCRAPVLRQLVGQRAALNITADLRALTPAEQAQVWEPNRLIWCLRRTGPNGPARLAWITRWHPADCPHDHVTEHRCPPGRTRPDGPGKQGALW